MSSPPSSRLRAAAPLFSAYSLLLTLALVAAAPLWLLRMRGGGRYREGIGERLGRIPARVPAPAPGVIWLHAVSVGEVLAAASLVQALRAAGRRVYISTTTRTGQALARERFGEDAVFYYPLDFAFAVRAWLRHVRPSALVLMESEFWPRMLFECDRAAVPVMVANARISDRSWPRYRRLRRLWQPLLAGLAATLAQSEKDAERLRALGAGHVQMTGNLKYDARPSDEAAITIRLREHLPRETKVVVCGSTLDGEEALLLNALLAAPGEPVLIFAPRHPERFEAVAALLSSAGRPFARRSAWQPSPIAPGTIFLLDTIGELGSLYSLATVACVGGSWFLPGGGHNPLEPALLGVPVVTGPYTANFAAIVELLRAATAICVASASEAGEAVRGLLRDDAERAEMACRARALAQRQTGATARTVAAIERVLGEQQR